MTWLRPIGATPGNSPSPGRAATWTVPILDDSAADESVVQAVLAKKQADRDAEHASAIEAVASSEQFVPSASMLSRQQLEQLKHQPTPYAAGAAGVVASKPPSTTAW